MHGQKAIYFVFLSHKVLVKSEELHTGLSMLSAMMEIKESSTALHRFLLWAAINTYHYSLETEKITVNGEAG